MKVLLINEECGTGSTGRICTDIATALEEQGHTVKIAYGRNADIVPEQFQKYAVRIGNDTSLILHGVKSRLLDATGFGSTAPTRKFIRWVKEYDPDVVHLHNLHGYYINIEVLFNYLKSCGKRILWTLHDVWAFTGHSAYCDAVQCEKWKTGCGNCPQLHIYPKSFIDKSKQNYVRKQKLLTGVPNLDIIVPSNWLANQVKESFLKKYPVSVIHNGIDTSKFRPVESDFRRKHGFENKFLILGVATMWNDLKGYSDFIELAQKLDNSYQIIMVGGREQAPDIPIPPNVFQINRTQDIQEMAAIYSTCDVYFNPTYCESYGLTNVEAASCGTPVITYNTGGCAESALEYGGVVVPRRDMDAVLVALGQVKAGKVKPIIPESGYVDKKRVIGEYLYKY